jgi:mRNA interferase HigB
LLSSASADEQMDRVRHSGGHFARKSAHTRATILELRTAALESFCFPEYTWYRVVANASTCEPAMRVISRRPLDQFAKVHPGAGALLGHWRQIAAGAQWWNFGSVRQTFPATDVYEKCVIFNIGGNKYRLIAAIHYQKMTNEGEVIEGRVYVRNVLTHGEYDKALWKKDCEC